MGKGAGGLFFLAPDEQMLKAFAEVSQWIYGQGYEPAGMKIFFQGADFYLVAHAKAHGYTVVTHEVPADSIRRIKIPNVCVGLGIRFMTPYEMLRREHARFVLGS